jgi:hypothetical protein
LNVAVSKSGIKTKNCFQGNTYSKVFINRILDWVKPDAGQVYSYGRNRQLDFLRPKKCRGFIFLIFLHQF